MTWIISGNCFNGFACVSDVQVTVDPQNGGKLRYYNCLKKTHVVCKNLCIAFCGDVRTGLLLIEILKKAVPESLQDGEYFDIDGQSGPLITFLRNCYKDINPNSEPRVDLVFCWNAQEGADVNFRPFCMRFRSPGFLMSSTPLMGLISLGSGASKPGYQDISEFLSGNSSDSDMYLQMFGDSPLGQRYWTVSKFRNLAARQAQTFDRPGISRSTTACTGTIDFAGMLSDDHSLRLRNLMTEIGLVIREERTSNDIIRNYEISLEAMALSSEKLRNSNPRRAAEVYFEMEEIRQALNYEKLFQLPHIEEFQELSSEEKLILPLLSDWDSVRALLEQDGIDLASCSATA